MQGADSLKGVGMAMRYSFPTGNTYVSVALIVYGIYLLVQGKIPIGDHRYDKEIFWVYGTKARIGAALLILGGIIAGYDLLIFVAYMLPLTIIFNSSNRK